MRKFLIVPRVTFQSVNAIGRPSPSSRVWVAKKDHQGFVTWSVLSFGKISVYLRSLDRCLEFRLYCVNLSQSQIRWRRTKKPDSSYRNSVTYAFRTSNKKAYLNKNHSIGVTCVQPKLKIRQELILETRSENTAYDLARHLSIHWDILSNPLWTKQDPMSSFW